jgi:hypothetical protein
MEDKTERRQQQRYKASEDVFAVVGPDAEIMGRIQEIGEGGLSFTYREKNRQTIAVSTIQQLSILSDGYHASKNEPSKFSVKVISDSQAEKETTFKESTVRRIGIQFYDLTFYQKAWLAECMKKYTLDDSTD